MDTVARPVQGQGDPVHSLQPNVFLASGLMLDALSLADCGVTWPLSSTLSIAYSLGPGFSLLSVVWMWDSRGWTLPRVLSSTVAFQAYGYFTPVVSVHGRLRQQDHMSSRLASAA